MPLNIYVREKLSTLHIDDLVIDMTLAPFRFVPLNDFVFCATPSSVTRISHGTNRLRYQRKVHSIYYAPLQSARGAEAVITDKNYRHFFFIVSFAGKNIS